MKATERGKTNPQPRKPKPVRNFIGENKTHEDTHHTLDMKLGDGPRKAGRRSFWMEHSPYETTSSLSHARLLPIPFPSTLDRDHMISKESAENTITPYKLHIIL